MTDPIADMLTRIRNAMAVRKPEVVLPFSKVKLSIAEILKSTGYISDVAKIEKGAEGNTHEQMRIVLKYVELGGLIRRMLVVLKARGSAHEKQLAEFEIMKDGFKVLGYYEGVEGLLTGAARYTKPPVDALEVMARIDKLRKQLHNNEITQSTFDIEVAKVRKEIERIQRAGV